MARLLVLVCSMFVLAACGADTPVPDYPFPESPNLDDTDLAEFVSSGDEDLEPIEDEEWDDGLDDEDLEMDGETPAEPPAEAAPAAG